MLLAYFDPGSASLLMQALVGGGAGLLVFARYVWASWFGGAVQASNGLDTSLSTTMPKVAAPVEALSLAETLSGEFRFRVS